jgi:hypothetical protein
VLTIASKPLAPLSAVCESCGTAKATVALDIQCGQQRLLALLCTDCCRIVRDGATRAVSDGIRRSGEWPAMPDDGGDAA